MKRFIGVLLIFFILVGCSVSKPSETGSELDSSRQALLSFFSMLHDQQFDEALEYFGGDYDPLRANNPDISPNYRDALLRRACTVNGFLCMNVKSIVKEEQLNSDTFQFTVEFQNEDGSLFILGPCCGATEEVMPSRSEFDYTVMVIDGRYQVMELPIFVP